MRKLFFISIALSCYLITNAQSEFSSKKELKKNQRKIEKFKKNIEKSKKLYTNYLGLASIYIDLDSLDLATFYLKKTLEINPKSDTSYIELATIERYKGNDSLSLEMLNKAIEIAPTADNYLHRAFFYCLRLGNYEKTITDINKVIELSSTPKSVVYGLKALCFYYSFEITEAIKNFSLAINLEPNEKEITEAIKNFSLAINLEPNEKENTSMYLGRGHCYYVIEKLELALADFNLYIENEKEPNPLAFYLKALTYFELNMNEFALNSIKIAHKMDPLNIDYLEGLELMNSILGNYDSSIENYNQLLAIDSLSDKYFLGRENIYSIKLINFIQKINLEDSTLSYLKLIEDVINQQNEFKLKERFTQFVKIAIPEYMPLVEKYYLGPENYQNIIATNCTLDELSLIDLFSTIIHESTHVANTIENSKILLFPDSLIDINLTEVIPSRNMTSFFEEKCSIENFYFYSVYIDDTTNELNSNLDGIYGLMNEFCAYYHDCKVSFMIYNRYKSLSEDDTYFISYKNYFIEELKNNVFAYYEFNLFMGGYLAYLKINNPNLYQKTITNESLKNAYTLLNDLYKQNIKEIESELSKNNDVETQNYLTLVKQDLAQFLPDLEVIKTTILSKN